MGAMGQYVQRPPRERYRATDVTTPAVVGAHLKREGLFYGADVGAEEDECVIFAEDA